MSFFHSVVQYYGFALMAVVLFLYFIIANRSFSPKILKYFYYAIFFIVALTISDIGHAYYATLSYPTWQRMFFASCSYSLRVLVILSILLLFSRTRSRNYKVLITLPAFINIIASFSAFITPKAFYYTADNVLVRGPIISIPFIVSAVYFILLVFESTQKNHRDHYQEIVLVYFIFLLATIATIMEAKGGFYGILPGLAIVCIMVYYMYFMSDNYYYDPLTDALIRTRLYQNCRDSNRAQGIIMYDLNDLKIMNDTLGHLSGDEALKSVARAAMNAIPADARLYRIGGDEFVVVSQSTTTEREVKELAESIRRTISNTPYSAAIGYSLREPGEELEKALSRADRSMYDDKEKTKLKKKINQ